MKPSEAFREIARRFVVGVPCHSICWEISNLFYAFGISDDGRATMLRCVREHVRDVVDPFWSGYAYTDTDGRNVQENEGRALACLFFALMMEEEGL